MSLAKPQSADDFLTSLVKDAVRQVLAEQHNRPQRNVYSESEVMDMLGVKSKTTMRELRMSGLVAHKIAGKWVYLGDEVEDFVRAGEIW